MRQFKVESVFLHGYFEFFFYGINNCGQVCFGIVSELLLVAVVGFLEIIEDHGATCFLGALWHPLSHEERSNEVEDVRES